MSARRKKRGTSRCEFCQADFDPAQYDSHAKTCRERHEAGLDDVKPSTIRQRRCRARGSNSKPGIEVQVALLQQELSFTKDQLVMVLQRLEAICS